WIFFYLAHSVDPGCVSATNTRAPGCPALHARLTGEYDDALESLGTETSNTGVIAANTTAPLCHSCHLRRPLRSKHCRVMRKCVLMFDHYCPFLRAAIGLYNYRYFMLYIVSHILCEIGFVITCSIYLHRKGWDWYMVLTMVYVGIFILPGIMMLQYHLTLMFKNLTTNEHQNMYRYEYLKDDAGRYSNPFDGGIGHNFYMRMMPSEDAFKPVSELGLEIGGAKKRSAAGAEGKADDEERLLNSVL
ncbi:hypothetical protein TeGR_g5239, partial [Tetraparma gracilis]